MTTQQTAAVVGAGPCGLSMLKTLTEDGFDVTCFERRGQVGGLWAYTEDPSMTTALSSAYALVSKYTCGMSDFPMPEKYPHHLSQPQFQEYLEDYARHFDVLQKVVFKASVQQAIRTDDDKRWRLEMLLDGKPHHQEFDKVAFCHGYQTVAEMPTYEGSDRYEGILMHSQQYRSVEPFKGKNVVIVGLSSSASELTSLLIPHVKSLRLSHRRGAYIIPIWRNNTPADLQATHRRREIGRWLGRYFPRAARWVLDAGLRWYMTKVWGQLDPKWRILPAPSAAISLPGASDVIIPLLREGKVESIQGIRRFIAPKTVELSDGTLLEGIDAVICATGYSANISVASSFLTCRRPSGYDGPPLANLYMNIFPPDYPDSMAILCYCSYCKTNGFSSNDVVSLAVSNVFRGVHRLPSKADMIKEIHEHHDWLASVYREDKTQGSFDPNMVQGWRFNSQVHDVAGTGLEALGWGIKGWKFWWKDPKMYKMMHSGIETAHAYRFFETGKRKTWSGAREAIIRINEEAKCFPLREEEKQQYVAVRGPA